MNARMEFLERELAFVRVIRATRKADKLYLVEPAVERERAILTEITRLQAEQVAEPAMGGVR